MQKDLFMITALITGANQGIGLEFARQLKDQGYYIIGCCLLLSKANELKKLADEIIQLDISSDQDIANLKQTLDNRPIDLLVNNAGMFGAKGVVVGNLDRQNFLNVYTVNCIGTLKVSEALLPNIKASQEKNIIVISSQQGSISDNISGRAYAYRASKAALHCVMRNFAIDVEADGIHIMLLHPGWVRTELGGPNALIDTKTSVAGMLEQAKKHLSTSHAEKLHRFDGGEIAW